MRGKTVARIVAGVLTAGVSAANAQEVRLGKLRLDTKVRIQADARATPDGVGDEVGVGQRRVGVQGRYGRVAFEVSGELGDTAPWRDAYAEYRFSDSARVQGGHFKLPMSLEATTGGGDLDFIRRSRVAAALGGKRNVGIMASGRFWERRVEYEAGLFRSASDGIDADDIAIGEVDADQVDAARARHSTATRVVVVPFAGTGSLARTLRIGVAASAAEQTEGVSPVAGRTIAGTTFSNDVYWVQGARRRMALEARWRPGPFGVSAELIRGTEERRGQGIWHQDLAPLSASGWYVGGAWVLTGERKTGSIAPARSVLQGGVGAVEVTGRVERFAVGETDGPWEPVQHPRAEQVPARGMQAMTTGINWYPHRRVKVQFNLARETLTGAAVDRAAPRPALFSRAFRVQFAL